ncbi:hypothetical protein O181_043889 [Austropuccinia psidii MF-1]|uniref:Uncharacterized protein n=1 Tax=Austropuccinia psidii MF-1 TaxID=1389203 RepID=A0A9Q3HIW3_9BASI|nr:hypothetical protein [Austropuccinia psidii MF-1]
MEATIQFNQMDVDKEDERQNPDMESLPQERHVRRMPEFPPIPQGEDNRALRRMEPIVLQRQCQKDEEFVEEPKSCVHRPEEGIGNDSSFGERRPRGIYQLQKCPKTSPKDLRRSSDVPRTIKQRAKEKQTGKDLTHRGTGSPNWSLKQWTVS